MSEFEEREYWAYSQQRFEAALRFATTKDAEGYHRSFAEAVELADKLLAVLEETRTKVSNEDTTF